MQLILNNIIPRQCYAHILIRRKNCSERGVVIAYQPRRELRVVAHKKRLNMAFWLSQKEHNEKFVVWVNSTLIYMLTQRNVGK